jgi:hypothetical protein
MLEITVVVDRETATLGAIRGRVDAGEPITAARNRDVCWCAGKKYPALSIAEDRENV